MNKYDVMFCVILRLNDESMELLERKLTTHSEIIGDAIHNVYDNCMVVPLFIKEADDENNILETIKNIEILDDEDYMG